MAIGRIPEPGTGIPESIIAAKGDILTGTANDTPAVLTVGTNGHTLVADSAEATGLKYQAPTVNTVIDAEGDLLVGDTADTIQRLAIGSNAQVLTVDTAVDGKIKWATPAGGGGKVLQVVQATTATYVSVASTSYTDTGLSGSITPTSATSKILVMATQGFGIFNSPDSGNFSMGWKLARDINGGGYSFVYTPTPTNNELWKFGTIQQLRALNNLVYLDSPATTSAVTYKLQAQTNSTASNQSVNFQNENAQTSVIIMMEIGA